MFRRVVIVVILAAVVMPTAAFAAPEWIPLVKCGVTGQPPCTPCYMFETLKNFIDLILYGITGPLAAFMFVLAGGMMLLGADNVKLQGQARKLFTNTVYGVAIVLVAWLATNFLLKSIGAGDVATHWYEFKCPAFLASINSGTEIPTRVEPIPEIPKAVIIAPPTNADFQQVAIAHNRAAYPRQNSPALQTLMTCLYADPIIKAMARPLPPLTGSARQTTGIYTYENDNEYCNYSRGRPVSGGSCEHAVDSCHYGGEAGHSGAEAIDMNAVDKMVELPGTNDGTGKPLVVMADDDALFCQLQRLLVLEKKCPFKLLNWEPGTFAHTHISTAVCDSDQTGVATRGGKLPDCANSARLPAVK